MEKYAYLFADDVQSDRQACDENERVGFLQVRLAAPREKKVTRKPVRKKDGEKNLNYKLFSRRSEGAGPDPRHGMA